MDNLIGQTIDNYKIIEVVGRGGMGVVFKAMDMNLEKIVALKMIDPFLARDENFLRRFKTEAKALAKLENPNIVSVYALRETHLGVFMVMEYVNAKTVAEWIQEKGKFSVQDTISITKQILNAIGHAHSLGIIHRDIKPNNVLLKDNSVKVMDFGLAKVIQEHGLQNTATNTAAGTLYYMSPEQIKGLKNVDNRSDIYSIGMTIYEMLAGRTPFDRSDSEYAIQKQIVDGNIPSPAKFNPNIPKPIIKYILKAIEMDPNKRFQSTDEMKLALPIISADETLVVNNKTRVITKNKTVFAQPDKKPVKKYFYYLAPLIVLIIITLGYFLFVKGKEEPVTVNSKVPPKKIVNEQTLTSRTAKLLISSNPTGAKIYINNSEAGVTPFQKELINDESYQLKIAKKGYQDWTNNEYKMKSGINNLDIILEPVITTTAETATITVSANPSGSIFLDNKLIASNSDQPVTKKIPAGSVTLKFTHPEFGTFTSKVNLSAGQTKLLTCYFQQQVSINSLNENGDAMWGTIYINGKNIDKNTPGNTQLSPGTYHLTVKKNGYKTVEDEKVITVTPTLQPKNHSLVFHFMKL